MNRLVIVADEKFEPLRLSLEASLVLLAQEIRAENLFSLVEAALQLLPTFARTTLEEELILWARSDRVYLVAWSSQPPQGEIIGATADFQSGLISEVFASDQTLSRKGLDLQVGSWTNLEEKRGQLVENMIGSPVDVFGRCMAVLTCVRYVTGPAAPNFDAHTTSIPQTAALLGRLLEDRLIRASLGLEAL